MRAVTRHGTSTRLESGGLRGADRTSERQTYDHAPLIRPWVKGRVSQLNGNALQEPFAAKAAPTGCCRSDKSCSSGLGRENTGTVYDLNITLTAGRNFFPGMGEGQVRLRAVNPAQ